MQKQRKRRIEWGLGNYYKCVECGKEFYIEAYQKKDYLYKTKKGLYCSYKCYCKNSSL